MSYFRTYRNIELSTIEYIRTQLNNDWNNPTINVVKSFKEASKAELPIVCITVDNMIPVSKEIGNTNRYNLVGININIFAKSDGQRLDLADYITEKLNPGWVYKDYERESGSSTLTGTENGRIRMINYIQNTKLDFGEEANPNDKFRYLISISVRYSND